MAKVLGVGGFFYKSADPAAARAWYTRVLGFEFQPWGGLAFTPDEMAAKKGSATVWNVMKPDSDYPAPSTREFMINLVVDDMDAVLARAKAEGVEPVKLFPDEGFGRFAHILDPDGIKLELWEPSAQEDEAPAAE
ncbi:MAG TPA: VOC family protein [Myxococcota bacterium]|nr:VOC family protein [Myxococcota bacterium]